MKRFLLWLSRSIDAVIFLAGAGLVSAGAAEIFPPAGYIVGGAALIALALLLKE